MKKEAFEAIAVLIGTIIGAGVLGIPYVVYKAGFFTGLLVILLIGLAVLITYICLGEVILRTKGIHQLTGYAEKYLGKIGKFLMTFAMIGGINGALIIYLIGEGETLSALFNGPPLFYSLLFFIVMSIIVFLGVKVLGESELLLTSSLIFVIIIMFLSSINKINLANLSGFSLKNLLIPYGVILFAFLGASAVPEMNEILIKNKKAMKKAIFIGCLIPLIVYILFTTITIAVTGENITEIATIGLGKALGSYFNIFGNLFAIFAMATCFIALGIALKEMYQYDYKINKNIAWLLTCFIPLILFLIGIRKFTSTIGFVGALAGGIESILIILMWWSSKKKSDRKPEYIINLKYLGYPLIIIFLIGAIYEIIRIIF